jgi:hypothetical protein
LPAAPLSPEAGRAGEPPVLAEISANVPPNPAASGGDFDFLTMLAGGKGDDEAEDDGPFQQRSVDWDQPLPPAVRAAGGG